MPAPRRTPAERTLAAASRVDLLRILQRGGSHTVGELAAATGLHENTTREHLARLVADGYAVRTPEARTVRGRPRMLYRVASPDDARRDPIAMGRLEESIAHVALTKVLISGFGRDLGPTREAARSAGYALTAPGGVLEPAVEPLPEPAAVTPGGPDAGDASRAVERRQLDALEGHLDRLGFDPERDDDALRIDLWRCPFLELARERPDVVCSVHLGLASGVLETVGGPLTADRLRPFVGREHCVLELRRSTAPLADA
ncbi:helix-turn-helix transcriptional regulator [Cellulomonas sp. CW35]|uniref:helix-turn-helix transcriptional regulator n=1 Tax=Cellulomonas sp. CW35 TaxID=3458249 RepID=UPI00403320F4